MDTNETPKNIRPLDISNFEEEVRALKNPFVIQFSSATCGPCQAMKPVMEALAKNLPDVMIFQVDIYASPELAQEFRVMSVPTIHICEGREVLYSFYGATPLGKLQFVLNNLKDPYFQTHGEFKQFIPEKDHKFLIFIVALILGFITLVALF